MTSAAPPLTNRAINRATLARQHLLERTNATALDEIAHLCGMQAQAPLAPYVGLWTRLRDFAPDELSELYRQRHVVRMALMRGTIHLATADEAPTPPSASTTPTWTATLSPKPPANCSNNPRAPSPNWAPY
jgi:hypothetical protein